MARTKAEITTKVRELEGKRQAAQLTPAGSVPTVAEWLRTWLDTIAPRTASATTIETVYRPRVERWVIPRIGGHRLDRLRPEHLDALYLELADAGLATKSVLMVHQILSRAYRMAMRRGIVGRNITAFVDPPRHREPEMSPLTQEEARRILTAATDVPNSARWSVALALGLRQAEALGLRWQHVDLDRKQIRVFQLRQEPYQHGCEQPAVCAEGRHRSRCGSGCAGHARYCPERVGGEWRFHEPKGGKARTLVLPAPLADQLVQHRTTQDAARAAAGPMWQELDLVFTQPDGRHLGPEQDWRAWKDLLKAARVPDARLHDARHTAATLLLEQGVDIRVVQQILGHSTLAVTKRYTHVTDTLARQAADRMGQALWD